MQEVGERTKCRGGGERERVFGIEGAREGERGRARESREEEEREDERWEDTDTGHHQCALEKLLTVCTNVRAG
eukprot:2742965-Rhodomonas_salina.1